MLSILNKNISNLKNNIKLDPINNALKEKITLTKKFLKEKDELLVTRVDKGNKTVIVEREEYNKKNGRRIKRQKILQKVAKKSLKLFKKAD